MSHKKGERLCGNEYFFRVKCKFLNKGGETEGWPKIKKRERKKEKFLLDYIYPLYTMEIMITGKFADISE